MGCHKNIGFDEFPEQGYYLNKKVEVCFNYDATKTIEGICIRDDTEEPFVTLFRLVDGRVVGSLECQYKFIKEES